MAAMSRPKYGPGEVVTSALTWRKSSFCQSGECLEVSTHDGMLLVRDSKAPQAGILSFDAEEFRSFVRGVVAGEFNDLVDP